MKGIQKGGGGGTSPKTVASRDLKVRAYRKQNREKERVHLFAWGGEKNAGL